MSASDLLRLFAGPRYEMESGPLQTYNCTAADRIDCAMASTDRAALEDAMCLPGLQKSVRGAIERRIRQLDKA